MMNVIKRLPKLDIKNTAVTTPELEVTIWSGTFRAFRLVLKFSFKTPDGTPLVQNCLEILPVIMGSHTGVKSAQRCLWFHESQFSLPFRENSGTNITR
jgi:hypothetical protein